jgi:5-methylcytosine-specific restriction endonuclease McrBC regulatory subunit McrC
MPIPIYKEKMEMFVNKIINMRKRETNNVKKQSDDDQNAEAEDENIFMVREEIENKGQGP